MVQSSIVRSAEKHKSAVQQMRTNLTEWAEEMQQTIPGNQHALSQRHVRHLSRADSTWTQVNVNGLPLPIQL